MVEVLTSSAWQRHLKGLRAELRVRRDTLVGALTEYAPSIVFEPPQGGVVAWAQLPSGTDEMRFVDACRARGVRVGAGRPFWLAEPPSPFVRLSFAGANAHTLTSASRRIGAALIETGS